eukprot:CAMPEP_0195517900 /NCGR_PEP_ID=MMETSP0794_2-20130614/11812_1 /TAXON_ID=515487 /ORGANISM="Stephanopyxis turris, Strain CCMP 815" /LENGTH=349 /DNA_ID=CAMNT_0040646777 /DNA_START=81 /DNA_END=1130 /DNA_ORIENTATION=-
MGNIFSAAVLTCFGALEGYAMALSGIPSPHFFRGQMTFKSFAIMKFFLGGVGSSMVAQGAMSAISPDRFEATRTLTNWEIPYSRTIPGCFILGIGMYVAGSGPTMIGAQLCMGLASAPYILAGALAGGTAFGVLQKPLGLHKPYPKGEKKQTSVDGRLGFKYETLAVPAGVLLLGISYGLEHVFPHVIESARDGVPVLSISPFWSSLAVGLNQIPIRIIKKTGQGGSTSVMNFVSTVTGGLISPQHKMTKIADAYQLLFVFVGIGSGAWLLINSTPDYAAPKGYSPVASAIGGFLGIFGSRIADGCTCGHGISGMSELSFSSIAGAMSIFAGGIFAGVVHSGLLTVGYQ